MELAPEQIFAQRYRVERLLARGGMGEVYVAEQLSTEAKVALKVLDPRVLESDTQLRAFKLEATVAGRVRSDHIVRTLDAGFDEATGLPYLVMELLHGTPLDELVERDGPLPAETVVEYLRQVASGLDRAHGYSVDGKLRPIVHRDLKPDNLLLTHRDSGEAEVKILDFGIAKVLGQTTGVSREIKGTPIYMAFEQAAGDTVTPQTDIWALGLIAFYLLTGKSYWRSASSPDGTLESLLGEVLALPLSPATERMRALGIEPGWPTEAFDAWFARCVHREPARRFTTAGDAAEALRAALLETARISSRSSALDTPDDPFGETVRSLPPAVPGVSATGGVAAGQAPLADSGPIALARRPVWPWLLGLAIAVGLGIALALGSSEDAPVVAPSATPGAGAPPLTPPVAEAPAPVEASPLAAEAPAPAEAPPPVAEAPVPAEAPPVADAPTPAKPAAKRPRAKRPAAAPRPAQPAPAPAADPIDVYERR